jgi:hypothetical protein
VPVPGIDWLVAAYSEHLVNSQLAAALEKGMNTSFKLFQAPTFANLDGAILDGVFTVGAQDVGAFFRNNLATFFNGMQVKVFMQDPNYLPLPYIDWDAWYQSVERTPVVLVDPRFSISFTSPSFNTSLKLYRKNTYGVRWTCPPTQKTCGAPPI